MVRPFGNYSISIYFPAIIKFSFVTSRFHGYKYLVMPRHTSLNIITMDWRNETKINMMTPSGQIFLDNPLTFKNLLKRKANELRQKHDDQKKHRQKSC